MNSKLEPQAVKLGYILLPSFCGQIFFVVAQGKIVDILDKFIFYAAIVGAHKSVQFYVI